MRVICLAAAMFMLGGTAFAGEIREFSVRTLERLGNEISRRDAIASRATDVVLETQPLARSLKVRGWITELRKDGDMVYIIVETPSGPSLAYTVTFRDSAKPEVQDVRGQPLPPNIAVRFKARQSAVEALKGRLFNIPYNFEVLDDPDGSGFLVYALGATTKLGQYVLAGHFRVTVSSDGEKVERVDALSRTLLIEDEKDSGLPKGTQAAGLFIVQLVSDKPVETLIYTSNLAKKPIVVGTPDRKIWMVQNGKMSIEKSKPGSDTMGGAVKQRLKQQ
jgi:hypothetical protein